MLNSAECRHQTAVSSFNLGDSAFLIRCYNFISLNVQTFPLSFSSMFSYSVHIISNFQASFEIASSPLISSTSRFYVNSIPFIHLLSIYTLSYTLSFHLNSFLYIFFPFIHFLSIYTLYMISKGKFEPEPGFEPRTSGFLARRSTT